MRSSSTAAAIVAAMTISQAVAGPAHRHLHRHVKKGWEDVDFSKLDYSKVDWESMDWDAILGGKKSGNGSPAPAASEPAPSSKDNKGAKSSVSLTDVVGDVTQGLWHGVVGAANDLTAFGGRTKSSGQMGDFYMGNVGVPWGSNMIKVDSESDHEYTINFENTSDEDMTVVIWNKAGLDGQPLSGGATAPKTPALTIALKPGQNQIVAFDEDSQIGFAQACDQTTFSGHFATSFGECNMTPNGAACNLSAILNTKGNTYKMKITNKENDCVSDETQNCWVTETLTLPDSEGKDRNGSCYIPAGQGGHFKAELSGQQ